MSADDMRILNQAQLVRLITEDLMSDVAKGVSQSFNNVTDRACTRTSLHNRIVSLRYKLKKLDNLLYQNYWR